ncbi:MAG TPA: DUF502 domain-containing protein [Planctomycetota bacterium]|nr:DUF502 domain-containing protein [Planctomycetota bacterium]
MARRISTIFLRGLAAFVPMALTIYIVWWTIATVEAAMHALLARFVPVDFWFPGMGLVAALLLMFLIGLFLSAYLARVVYRFGERIVERIPVVKSIYGMIRDTLDFFTHRTRARYDRVVSVRLFGQNVRVLGFITRTDFQDLPAGIGGPDTVGVYLPMSYQLGGYLVMVPRDSVEPIDMSMEDALRFAMTAGMRADAEPDSAD